MNIEPWQAILVAIITVAGSGAAARYAGRSSVKVKELDVDAAAYERAERINSAAFLRMEGDISDLRTRSTLQDAELTKLRDGMDKVTRAFRIAMNFIEQFLLWERDGSQPPRPNIPESLKEYLDPSLIREHIRQQERDDKEGIS
jgi:hypothetical protein